MSLNYPDTMSAAEHSDSPAPRSSLWDAWVAQGGYGPPGPRSSFKLFLAIMGRGGVTSLAALGAMSIGVPGWVLLAAWAVYGIVSYTRFRRQERREAVREAAIRG